MAGLARLPAGSAYQLWAVQDGSWNTIGVCNTDADGWWQGSFPYALRPGEDVAVTVEPAGGSARPTSQPILQSAF
jgi:anti-sigma-K factor RskA